MTQKHYMVTLEAADGSITDLGTYPTISGAIMAMAQPAPETIGWHWLQWQRRLVETGYADYRYDGAIVFCNREG